MPTSKGAVVLVGDPPPNWRSIKVWVKVVAAATSRGVLLLRVLFHRFLVLFLERPSRGFATFLLVFSF